MSEEMTRKIALYCMKAYSELHSEVCEECEIYGQTGCDHCFEDALQLAIASLETDEAYQLEYEQPEISKGLFEQIKWERDIAIEQLKELGYEFGEKIEPTTKNDLGVDVPDNNVGNIDCISRADAIGSIAVECSAENLDIDYAKFLMLRRAIKALPAVTPQEPRKGHWISHREHCEMNNLRPSGLGSYFWCSECDCGIDSKDFARVNYNYCPNCGAKMVESQKSEG